MSIIISPRHHMPLPNYPLYPPSSCNHNCSDFLLLLVCFILMHQEVCHVSLRWSGSAEPMEMKQDAMHPIPTLCSLIAFASWALI